MGSAVFESEDARERVASAIAVCEELLEGFAETRRVQEDIVQALTEIPPGPLRASTEAAVTLWKPEVLNAIELATLYRLEAASLVQDFQLAKGARKAMYARLLLVTVYESMSTLRRLLGKAFREEMMRVVGPETSDQLNEIGKRISETFARTNEQFKDLRNQLAVHRSPDAMQRLYHLSNTDGAAIASLSAQAFSPLVSLSELYARYQVHHLEELRHQAKRVHELTQRPWSAG